MMSDDTAITFAVEQNVGIVTLNLPKKLNALTTSLYYRLGSLLREADIHPDTLVTLIIGTGRFFSAGADLQASAATAARASENEPRRAWLPALVNNSIDVPSAFFSHSKILICALNGPVIGLSAALVSHADFVYAVPEAYLLTPFGSLGLVSEGGASAAFMRRMGLGLANEALLKGRKITADELKAVGFVNNIVSAKDEHEFRACVLEDVKDSFGSHLVPSSVLETKRIMRRSLVREQEGQALDELFTGVKRFAEGIPQAEMKKIMTGQKKYKL
ncbi:putative enoyl-CoA isomerase [Corynespora cassiicola Philippines]|uniref:Putative enoyl-CoA isomerase n=1 Tax=Corynespora cassiicola Philippines TaxID=1448308 RepID=A0A2T2P7R5_CORCC|nr:putative enoyl-CoA isomerase [Corynespora cassiicola Philippines]